MKMERRRKRKRRKRESEEEERNEGKAECFSLVEEPSVSVSPSVPMRPRQAITHCSVPLPPQQASGLEHNSLKFFLILHCFIADDADDVVGDSG